MKLKPERWQQIETIYFAALELKDAERDRYLCLACGSDSALRREVESLLSSHERAGNFLDTPALEVAAKSIADTAASAVGATIGHYKIIAPIGAGGMGEVYLVEDQRLGRRVALKLLPAVFTRDIDRLRRFEREARAASALNHPNIIAIYDIGEIEGIYFIATEYVVGETLRARLKGGRLDITESLAVAAQIGAALSAAHQAGLVHRDIKPENIMLRPDGYVKLLDFGLVKLVERERSNPDPARDVERIKTETGLVLGTASYMSPEQARGLDVDGRTDIFSLGIVLYEMTSGCLPFEGETTADALVSLLEREPRRLSHHIPGVEPELERIISRALEKDRARRYQSVDEMLTDIKRLKEDLDFKARMESGDGITTRPLPSAAVTTLSKVDTGVQEREALASSLNRRKLFLRSIIVVAAIISIAAAGWLYWHKANREWAREQIPRIEEMARAQKYFEAFDLATSVSRHLPEDPALARLMPQIAAPVTIATEPAGALVFIKRFTTDERGESVARELLGATPLADTQLARGDYILQFEKDGYSPAEIIISTTPIRGAGSSIMPPPVRIEHRLIEQGAIPEGMVFVPGGDYRLVSWRRPTDTRVRLDDYFIDKYEVSNSDYKEFILSGGYLKREYWKHAFHKAGRSITREEAMAEMRDRTGLPGPRDWSNQQYPEGKADHPVTGITWYEAAAYAEFRGKRLPTVFQWEKAARNGRTTLAGLAMPWGVVAETTDYRANFRGNGTLARTALEFGMSPYGCYNMAGNAAEWCANATGSGFIAAGGSWEDPAYLFGYFGEYPAFEREGADTSIHSKIGFRCVVNSTAASGDQGAMNLDLDLKAPSFKPVSDAEYGKLAAHYEYGKRELDAEIVEVKEGEAWTREKIVYNGAAGKRAIAYLYLPKYFQRPLQVLHSVPAGDVFGRFRPLPEATELTLDPLIRSGRAVFSVVLEGFIERDREPGYQRPATSTIEFVEETARYIEDMRRGLDYLETRGDIDASRIAYFGPSASDFKLIIPAVEPRYRAVIFNGAAVRSYHDQWHPAANPINFAPRIRAPKLLMHGRYDEAAPLKTEGKPLYALMSEPMRVEIFEGGHIPYINIMIPTFSGWLDQILGPPRPIDH
jgi:serine/threonine protein kinase/formylglycine-generating enzyme required for sulfatase activity/dienelactone hydrolase